MKINVMNNKRIMKLMNKVWDNYQKGDTKKSIIILEEALQKYPKDKWLVFVYAEFHSFIGKKAKAIEKLNDLLEKEPNFSEGWALLGEIYLKANKVKKATKAFEKAVNIKPTYSWMDSLLSLYFSSKKIKLANKLLKNALKDNPTDYWFKVLFGLTYLFSNKPKRAFSIVKSIIEDQPDLLSGKFNIGSYALNVAGTCKLENKEYEEAAKYFKEALKINQNIYTNLALCYYYMKNYKLALKYAKTAILIDREDNYAWEVLGKIYLEIYEWSKAAKALQQSFLLGNNKHAVKVSLCLALLYSNELKKAKEKCLYFLKENPNDKHLLYMASLIFYKENEFDKALDYLEQAINHGFPPDQIEINEFYFLMDDPRFMQIIKPSRN